jgi:hypothetical protein
VSVNFQIPAGSTAPVEQGGKNRGPFLYVDRPDGLAYRQTQERLRAAGDPETSRDAGQTVTLQYAPATGQYAPATGQYAPATGQYATAAGQYATAAGLRARTEVEQGQIETAREPRGEPTGAEREQRLREQFSYERQHASGEPGEIAIAIPNPNSEGRVQERRFLFSPEISAAGRILKSIEVRGMTDEAGNQLLARLPLREGDTIPAGGWETIRRAVTQFDEHLECSFEVREGGVIVLGIHPAGSAREPLIHRK